MRNGWRWRLRGPSTCPSRVSCSPSREHGLRRFLEIPLALPPTSERSSANRPSNPSWPPVQNLLSEDHHSPKSVFRGNQEIIYRETSPRRRQRCCKQAVILFIHRIASSLYLHQRQIVAYGPHQPHYGKGMSCAKEITPVGVATVQGN